MGQEIVVFREDLMAKMMRNLVGVKRDLESTVLKRYVSLAFCETCSNVFNVGA